MSRRFPAEWEPCECVWLAWPHNRETWPGHYESVPDAFAAFVVAIAESVPVRVLVSGSARSECRKSLGAFGAGKSGLPDRVDLVDVNTNDCWVRDTGPTFVWESTTQADSSSNVPSSLMAVASLVAVDWQFNAWGGKYHPHHLDAAVARRVARIAGLRRESADLTLEGGSLETDGARRLLINPACVLDPKRNPGRSKNEIAQALHRYLGVEEIVWIDGGSLAGDDTDGHIDQIARFLDPETVVVAVTSDPNDPSHEDLEANFRQLRIWSRQTSPIVDVHRLPIPPRREINGSPVPQSYCNFLRLGTDRMLVPTFASKVSDDRALGILRELCPEVDVVSVDCHALAWGLGALHCMSCHQPLEETP